MILTITTDFNQTKGRGPTISDSCLRPSGSATAAFNFRTNEASLEVERLKSVTMVTMGEDDDKPLDSLLPENCNIEIRNSLSLEEFDRDFRSIKRPVLIRGLTNQLPAYSRWNSTNFVRLYGDLIVQVGSIPYANTYSYDNNMTTAKVSIAEYVKQYMGNTRLKYPPYVFDAKVLHQHPDLLNDVLPLSPIFDASPRILTQFMLGPRFSGAPPHFHGAAANLLIHGVKRWFLFPPSEASFSIGHVRTWYEERYPIHVQMAKSGKVSSVYLSIYYIIYIYIKK